MVSCSQSARSRQESDLSNVIFPTTRQMGQLLAEITNLGCDDLFCIRNIESFILCPVDNNIRIAVSSKMIDLSSNGGILGNVGLTSSLVPVGLIREKVLLIGICIKLTQVV